MQYLVCTFLCMLLLIPGCATFVQEPRVTLVQTSLVGVDTSGVELEFYLDIANPNAFDLSLLSYTYNLKIMTLPLSSGGKQDTVLFSAGKNTGIRLPVRLKYNDLLEIIKRQPDPDKIPYRMDARLFVDTPLGEMVIPVEKDATLSIPQKYRPSKFLNNLQDALRSIR
jgi:LEA14-like dessication related protein